MYRRSNGLARTVNDEVAARYRRLAELLATITGGRLQRGVFPPSLRGKLPYTYAASFRILGVALSARMGFEEHVGAVIGRTTTRHGVMAQLARTTYGLEAGLLRSTHKALITSVVVFGLTSVGGFAYEKLIGRLEAQSSNVAAR